MKTYTFDDPELGPIRTVGVLYNLDTSPGEIKGPAPTLGQHTDEVLGELLDMDLEELETLRKDGVI